MSRVGAAFAVASAVLVPGTALALPPGFLPTHFPGEAQPQAGQVCNLTYANGPLISKIEGVAVWWGATSSTIKSWAPGYMQALVTSPSWDALSEYNAGGQKIVRGTYKGAYAITPKTQTGSTVDDSNGGIGQELEAQISAGALPQPTYDSGGHANTIYVIYFAPGISINGGGGSSCVSGGFCGYHGSWTHSGHSVPYAVIPDMGPGSGCDQGCAPQGSAETVALGGTVSHEMSEATTDEGVAENKIAWYDNSCNGEIGDLCAPGSGPAVGAGEGPMPGGNSSYIVQYEWSNSRKTCEIDNPSIGPQGGCTSNAQCTAPTPVCNTTKQTCVGCLTNTDCTGNKPICDTTSNTCRACKSNSDCAAPTPICALADAGSSAGECVQCESSKDCSNSAPVCSAGKCGGCTSNSDCTDPNNPECDTSSGSCGPMGSSSGSGNGSGGGSGSGNGSGGTSGGSGGSNGGSGSGGEFDGGTGGSSNGSSGGNGDFGGSTSSSGCALSAGPTSDAFGFAGLAFGLAALSRVRRSRRRS